MEVAIGDRVVAKYRLNDCGIEKGTKGIVTFIRDFDFLVKFLNIPKESGHMGRDSHPDPDSNSWYVDWSCVTKSSYKIKEENL